MYVCMVVVISLRENNELKSKLNENAEELRPSFFLLFCLYLVEMFPVIIP